MKLLILSCSSLTLTWLSLNSLLFALAYWGHDGAFMPALAGGLGLLASARLLLATVRIYLPPKNRRAGGLLD